MNNDQRYAPPRADVTEAWAPRPPRPTRVKFALSLLWAGFAVELLNLWLGFGDLMSMALFTRPVGWFLMASHGLDALLILLVQWGKNWARTVMLVLIALAIGLTLKDLTTQEPSHDLELVLTWGSYLLRAVALVLLFTPTASRWFKWRPALNGAV